MITRKVPSPHICLRCRSALAKLPPAASQLRHASNRSGSVSDKYAASTKEELGNASYRVRSNKQSRNQREGVAVPPLGKFYGHPGQFKQEALEDLKTKSLNDPARAIVLRDTIFSFYTHDREALKPQLAEHIDIEQQLNEERGLVGQDEVNENIHSLKPQPDQEISSWEDINLLMRNLQDGFTTSQILKYIEKYGKQTRDAHELEWESSMKGGSISRITPWLPGISSIEHMFDADPLRGYFLDSHTNKQRIILRLLRHCWNVELPEVAEGLGQFEMQVKPKDLDLLLLGPDSAIDSICSRNLTFEKEKIEVFRQRDVLRITTTRNKRRWIVMELEQALNSVTRQTIDLSNIIPPEIANIETGNKYKSLLEERVDGSMLQELSRFTKCSIVRKEPRFIEVSYLRDKASKYSQIEDIKRLLVASVHGSGRVETQLAYAIPNNPKTGFVKHPSSLTTALPWFDRHREWSRWTAPITVGSTTENTLDQDHPTGSLAGSAEVLAPNLLTSSESIPESISNETESTLNPKTASHWKEQYATQTSALIGTVLHRDIGSHVVRPWDPQEKKHSSGKEDGFEKGHTFAPHVPNLTRMLSSSGFSLGGARTNYLVLRFIPSPFVVPKNPKTSKKSKNTRPVGPQVLSAFPPVEMRFQIHKDTQEIELKGIRALMQEMRTDIMLPEKPIDMRFEQLTISRLRREHLENFKQYIESSNLSFANGSIKPIPTIKIPISEHLTNPPGFSIFKNNLSTDGNSHEIEYMFAGLEIRSTLSYNWQGWKLNYTSIRAGRAGGRRSELRLLPLKNEMRVTEEEFVKAAYEFANFWGGDNSKTASAFVPEMDSSRIRRVAGGSSDVVRKIDTEHGSLMPKFRYFVKRTGINTVPGAEDEEAAFSETRSSVPQRDTDQPLLDEEDDDEERDFIDLAYGRQLEEEMGGKPRDGQLETKADVGVDNSAKTAAHEDYGSSNPVRTSLEVESKDTDSSLVIVESDSLVMDDDSQNLQPDEEIVSDLDDQLEHSGSKSEETNKNESAS